MERCRIKHPASWSYPPNECGVGWWGMSRCYWCFLMSVWKPTKNTDAKSCFWLLETNRRWNSHVPLPQNWVLSAKCKFCLLMKHGSIIQLLLLLKCGPWCSVDSPSRKGYMNYSTQRPGWPDQVCEDVSLWWPYQPMNEFLNDSSIFSNRSSLAETIVTFSPASELGFQFSRSLRIFLLMQAD